MLDVAFNQEKAEDPSLVAFSIQLREVSFSALRVEVLGWFMVGCNVCIETSGKIHDLCLSKYTWQVMAAAHRRTALRGGSSVAESAGKEQKSGKYRKLQEKNVKNEEILMLFCFSSIIFPPYILV